MSTAVPILGMITLLCKLIVAIYSSIAIDISYILYIAYSVFSISVTYIYGIWVVESERVQSYNPLSGIVDLSMGLSVANKSINITARIV